MNKYVKYSSRALIGAFWITSLSLLASCAQQGMPSGGPKDEQGPKVLYASPNFGEVNYSGEDFILEFDEFVRPNQLNSELIISPPISKESEAEIKGKKLIIPLFDSLQENTTYTVSLRNGIKDLNEGNPLDSNLWVFSTGPELDSGYIEGKVKDAFSKENIAEMWVMLYAEDSDSLPYTSQATYLTQSDANGRFRFDYLPENESFKLFALKDENADYLFSLPTEQIAFSSATVISASDSIKLSGFIETNPLTYIKEYKQIDQKFISLKFSQSIRKIQVEGIGFELKADFEKIQNPVDSLILNLYYSETQDSLALNLLIDDLNTDTIYLLSEPDSGRSYLKASFPGFHLAGKKLAPEINRAVSWSEAASILLLGEADTLSIPRQDDGFYIPDSLSGSFEVSLDDSSYCTPQGQCNDSISFKILFLDTNEAPDLIVKIPDVENAMVELLDSKGGFLNKQAGKFLKFKDLKPGKYKMRLFVDQNKNGFWDTGDYLKGNQPEKLYHYQGEIDLKKSFDLELVWELSP